MYWFSFTTYPAWVWGHRDSLQCLQRKVQVKIKHMTFLLQGNSASRCTTVLPLLFMISFLFQGNRKNKAYENLVNCLLFVHGMGRKSNTKEVFVLSKCRLIPCALDLITYRTLQEGEAQQRASNTTHGKTDTLFQHSSSFPLYLFVSIRRRFLLS